jgi:FAD:protein FMN transferase
MSKSGKQWLALLAVFVTVPASAEWRYQDAAVMGTRVAVQLWATDTAQAESAISDVLAEMRRIDELMSTYKSTSEISRVNQAAARAPQRVSAELFALLETAQRYSELSGGAFDITYASVGYLYDFRAQRRPSSAAIRQRLGTVDYRALKLDAVQKTVTFGKAGMRIDLGGIAKGYAVDRGIAILKRRGIAHAMVNAGGDTRVIGSRDGKPWVVGIRHPDRANQVVLRMPLEEAAFSTSGDYERFFEEGGTRYHHIIDPKTGDSARSLRSATVIAGDATRTDALSTALFVLGPERGLKLVNSLSDVDAVLVTPQGQVLYSKGLTPPAGASEPK